MTFKQMRQINEAVMFRKCPRLTHEYRKLAGMVAKSVGDRCQMLKKIAAGEELDRDDIANQIAGAIIAADCLCVAMGIELASVIENNVNVGATEWVTSEQPSTSQNS